MHCFWRYFNVTVKATLINVIAGTLSRGAGEALGTRVVTLGQYTDLGSGVTYYGFNTNTNIISTTFGSIDDNNLAGNTIHGIRTGEDDFFGSPLYSLDIYVSGDYTSTALFTQVDFTEPSVSLLESQFTTTYNSTYNYTRYSISSFVDTDVGVIESDWDAGTGTRDVVFS